MFYIVGLGNPGEEYKATRHNTGRIVLEIFRKASEGKLGKAKVMLIAPDTFMNKSGDALKNFQFSIFNFQEGKKKKKGISNLAVIHDDLDIPFGSYKVSFNKSSGGHKGVESVIKAVKTTAFVRIRVGISPFSAKATKGEPVIVLKKPKGEAAVEKMILGNFTADQLAVLKKLSKRISDALICLVTEGREKAMSQQGSF